MLMEALVNGVVETIRKIKADKSVWEVVKFFGFKQN